MEGIIAGKLLLGRHGAGGWLAGETGFKQSIRLVLLLTCVETIISLFQATFGSPLEWEAWGFGT